MEAHLYPCECCGRHMRTTDSSCPFCFTAQSAVWPPVSHPRVVPRVGTTRAALFVGALLMSPLAGVTACGGSEPIAQPYGAPPEPTPQTYAQPYGAPPHRTPPPLDPTEDETRDERDENEGADEDVEAEAAEERPIPVPAYGGPRPLTPPTRSE